MAELEPQELINDLATSKASIDIRVLLNLIMQSFGGAQKFADEFVYSIQQSETGSSAQIQAYNSVMKALLQFGYEDDADTLLDEDAVTAMMQQIISEEKDAAD